jgi:peptide/nickel transport system substrate-binding protein
VKTRAYAAILATLALAAAASAAVPDRVVVVNDVTDPVSLDPHREFDASSDNIVNQIFDGLVRLSPQGQIEPALAVSWNRVDDLTIEFHLRQGVKFHDGEPFTAEAVRFSFLRQVDPARPAPNAGVLSGLTEVQVVDALTVRLKTRKPDGMLLNKLPMFFKILPPVYLKKVGDAGFAAKPVGTGPYRFIRWDKGREIELEANPQYWMAGRPAIHALIFRFIPTARQLEALLAGEVDMLTDLSGLDTIRVARTSGNRVMKSESIYAVSLIPNSRKPPFSDVRARRALAHLIDAEELVRYAAKGNGRRLAGFTVPGQFGHHPAIAGYELDKPRAMRLLAEAGLKPGLKIKVLVREEIRNFGLILVSQLKRGGIAAELETASQEQIYQKVVRPNLDPALPRWDGDLLMTHYVDPTAHAYFPYMIFVHSKGPYSLVSDPKFDALFDEMTQTLSTDKQKELCFQLEEMVSEKALAFSPVQVIRPFGIKKNLRYEPYVAGMLDFRTAYWSEP